MYRCFRRVAGFGSGNHIFFGKSKVLSGENVTAPTISDYSLKPQLSHLGTKTRVEVQGNCLEQDKKKCFIMKK